MQETKSFIELFKHDGTFESCDRARQWALAHGFDFISSANHSGSPSAYVVRIGREQNIVRMRAGDFACVVGERLTLVSLLKQAERPD